MTRIGWIFISVAVLILSGFLALSLGATQIDFSLLMAGATGPDSHIFWNIRLPRVLLAAQVGVHFAMAGMILQTVTRNALADPGVLGINGGAVLFMSIYVMFEVFAVAALNSENYQLSMAHLPIAALFGAVLGAAFVFGLSWKQGISPRRFVLIGVAVGSFAHAVALGLIFGWGPTKQDLLWIWIAGSLYGATWEAVTALVPWTVGITVVLRLTFRKIAMLRLDDDSALTRGLNVEVWRILALLLACIYAGTAVGAAGPVGFVGLVVPHIVRRLISDRLGLQFIATFFVGATLVMLSDGFGRAVFAPAEIPVGIITSLIGAPVLFVLLFPFQRFKVKVRRHAIN